MPSRRRCFAAAAETDVQPEEFEEYDFEKGDQRIKIGAKIGIKVYGFEG